VDDSDHPSDLESYKDDCSDLDALSDGSGESMSSDEAISHDEASALLNDPHAPAHVAPHLTRKHYLLRPKKASKVQHVEVACGESDTGREVAFLLTKGWASFGTITGFRAAGESLGE
jgi:hypothetical protein